jgi:ADP-heptose:LPS heptosyltransferase
MRQRYMNGNYLEATHQVAGVPQDYRQRHYATPAELVQAREWRAGMPRLVVAAATGSGVNKIWPGLFEYVWRIVDRNPDAHVAVIGDLKSAKLYEHPRIHELGQTWPIRRGLALALVADVVIGQETGTLNAVALDTMPKIVLLSHSSPENLTKHWENAWTMHGDVDCYPCHRLHSDWSGCRQDPETQLAACQSKITPMAATLLTERLLGIEHRAAA